MKVKDITNCIENIAPLMFQESYDNSGLIVGDKNYKIDRALICLDVTDEIINEAIEKDCHLIIAHHPIIFKAIKKINNKTRIGKILLKAIKHDIAIYAAHTNLDNIIDGVNSMICQKLDLKNVKILSPKTGLLRKIVTFCPVDKAEQVRNAMFKAGAGTIGNYDNCSFNSQGLGSFKAGKNTNPYVGEIGKLHYEDEIKIETIFPVNKESEIIDALLKAHPYEEVAYDIYPLENKYYNIGAGMIGELEFAEDEFSFLKKVKDIVKIACVRHSKLLNKKVKKIAVCGGSGSFLIKDAIIANADVFLTADIKYHDFFDANDKIVIADIGHYESEQFAKELLYNILNKKFPNFAFFISKINTNSINYL